MSGKRIIDMIALAKVSRDVASKHIALQGRQLQTYSKSSSLAKLIKIRARKANTTFQAASTIVRQPSEPTPSYSTRADGGPMQHVTVPSAESVAKDNENALSKEGLEQDHFYKRSESNTTSHPLSETQLGIKQEQAKRSPLSDGTIPPQDLDIARVMKDTNVLSKQANFTESPIRSLEASSYEQNPASQSASGVDVPSLVRKGQPHSANDRRRLQRQAEDQIPQWSANPPGEESFKLHDISKSQTGVRDDGAQDTFYSQSKGISPALSSLPRVKIPKATSHIQESDEHVHDQQINQDVYYSSGLKSENQVIPEAQAMPEQERVPESLHSEIFHSPKIARMLSGNAEASSSPSEIRLQHQDAAEPTQVKPAKAVDRDTFSTRGEHFEIDDSTSDASDVHTLAANISNDTQSNFEPGSEVRNVQHIL